MARVMSPMRSRRSNTLDVASRLKRMLEQVDYEVIMTRTSDVCSPWTKGQRWRIVRMRTFFSVCI